MRRGHPHQPTVHRPRRRPRGRIVCSVFIAQRDRALASGTDHREPKKLQETPCSSRTLRAAHNGDWQKTDGRAADLTGLDDFGGPILDQGRIATFPAMARPRPLQLQFSIDEAGDAGKQRETGGTSFACWTKTASPATSCSRRTRASRGESGDRTLLRADRLGNEPEAKNAACLHWLQALVAACSRIVLPESPITKHAANCCGDRRQQGLKRLDALVETVEYLLRTTAAMLPSGRVLGRRSLAEPTDRR